MANPQELRRRYPNLAHLSDEEIAGMTGGQDDRSSIFSRPQVATLSRPKASPRQRTSLTNPTAPPDGYSAFGNSQGSSKLPKSPEPATERNQPPDFSVDEFRRRYPDLADRSDDEILSAASVSKSPAAPKSSAFDVNEFRRRYPDLADRSDDEILKAAGVTSAPDDGRTFGQSVKLGTLRARQSLAAGGAALGGALVDDEGFFDTSPIGKWLQGQTEKDRQQVMALQKKIEAIPQDPTLQAAVERANQAPDALSAIREFKNAVAESPNKLSFFANMAGEQIPVMATMLLGTKGAGGLVRGAQAGKATFQGASKEAASKLASTAATRSATVGAGSAIGSIASTFGPRVAEGLQEGLAYDDAESRAAKMSAVQAIFDGTAGAVVPFKIGPNRWTDIPTQAVIQMASGAGGEAAAQVTGGKRVEDLEKGEIIAEGLLELIGLPGDVAASVMEARRSPGSGPIPADGSPPQQPAAPDPEVIAAQAAETVRQAPQAEINKDPRYKELLAQGVPLDEAREQIAQAEAENVLAQAQPSVEPAPVTPDLDEQAEVDALSQRLEAPAAIEPIGTEAFMVPGADIEALRANLPEGVPAGTVVTRDGQPVGLRFANRHRENVEPALAPAVPEAQALQPEAAAAPDVTPQAQPESEAEPLPRMQIASNLGAQRGFEPHRDYPDDIEVPKRRTETIRTRPSEKFPEGQERRVKAYDPNYSPISEFFALNEFTMGGGQAARGLNIDSFQGEIDPEILKDRSRNQPAGVGAGMVFVRNGGLNVDEALGAAIEEGFLPPDADASDLVDSINRSLAGEPVLTPQGHELQSEIDEAVRGLEMEEQAQEVSALAEESDFESLADLYESGAYDSETDTEERAILSAMRNAYNAGVDPNTLLANIDSSPEAIQALAQETINAAQRTTAIEGQEGAGDLQPGDREQLDTQAQAGQEVETGQEEALEQPGQVRKSEAGLGATTGTTPESLRAAIEKELGPKALSGFKVKFVPDIESAARLIGRPSEDLSGTQALTTDDGTIVPITSQIPAGSEVGVFMHEGVHSVVRPELVRNGAWDRTISDLKRLRTSSKPVQKAYRRVPKDTPESFIDEEALAYLIENNPRVGVVKRFMNAVRAALRRLGVRNEWLKTNESELRQMVIDSLRRRAREGQGADLDTAVASAARASQQDDMFGGPSRDEAVEARRRDIDEKLGGREDIAPESQGDLLDPNREKQGDIDDLKRSEGQPLFSKRDERVEGTTAKERYKKLVRKKWAQEMTSSGGLPPKVFRRKVERDNRLGAADLHAHHLMVDFDRAVKGAYGKKGAKLPKAQQEAINDALAGGPTDNIPGPVLEAMKPMRAYLDALSRRMIENGVVDPESEIADTIRGNIGKYLTRSYRAFDDASWPDKVRGTEVWTNAVSFLESQVRESNPNMTDAQVTSRATGIANNIIEEGTAAEHIGALISRGSKVGAKDLSMLIRRKVIAPEIRELLGEYKDPRTNFVRSATKMHYALANHYFLEMVRREGLGSMFFQQPEGEFSVRIAGDESEAMSPLNGLYTTPEIKEAFELALDKEHVSDMMRTVLFLNGAVKYGKVVVAPTTQARNFLSAFFFTVANGHFASPSRLNLARKTIAGELKTGKSQRKYALKLKRLGVIYDNPRANELNAALRDLVNDENLMSEVDVQGPVRKTLNYMTRLYQAGDDFWKIVGFESEKAALIKHKGLSEAEAEVQAAERIRNTYPTYSLVPKRIRWLRRFPLVGTFVSFPAEIVRTSKNIVQGLNEDRKTHPKLAARRAVGILVAGGWAYALSELTKDMMGLNDEDDEALKEIAPPWQRNSLFGYTGYDEDGQPRYVDLSYLDPYNYITRPVTAILKGGDPDKALSDAMIEMATPFLGADIAAQAVGEVLFNKSMDTGAPIFNEAAAPFEQFTDVAEHIIDATKPGIMGNVERIHKALQGDVSRGGKQYSMADEMGALVGFRITTANLKESMVYRGYEFGDRLRDSTRMLSYPLGSQNKMEDEEIAGSFESMIEARNRAFEDMIKIIDASRKLGLSDRDLLRLLGAANISRKNAVSLIRGRVLPWSMSKQFLNAARERAVSTAGTRERQREINREFDRRVRLVGRLTGEHLRDLRERERERRKAEAE